MSLRVSHLAPFAALLLLFVLASPAFGDDGSAAQASSSVTVTYKVLDPVNLGKEAKPLYDVASYFRIKELREIADREKAPFIVPSETGQEPNALGIEARPLYDVASYFKIKEVREIADREKGPFVVPSETGQEPNVLGNEAKPLYSIDAYYRQKDLREIGSEEKNVFLVPSKIRA